ncbi:MAG: hypothetical protein KTR24_01410 [Saprospiraceae bacterium]|nr:hypothetical protein [Saprospiraceae bacterium]
MARLITWCYKNHWMTLTLLFAPLLLHGQVNCLIYDAASGERIACELSLRAIQYRQGSRNSQLLFDKAIEVGPKFAWAYYEKSVPFFKRGLLAEGVSLINKAIDLEPKNYLYYRAYWYFYNRSYAHCIEDLEELYTVHHESFTNTPGGEMEMRMILAMAYAQSGEVEKGIEWAQHLMDTYKEQPHLKGQYDHHILGVLYYLNNRPLMAAAQLEKQLEVNARLADTHYYLGLINRENTNSTLAQLHFKKAWAKLQGEGGGHSPNIFEGFNVSAQDIEGML